MKAKKINTIYCSLAATILLVSSPSQSSLAKQGRNKELGISVSAGSTLEIGHAVMLPSDRVSFYTVDLVPQGLGECELAGIFLYSGVAFALRPLEGNGMISTAELLVGKSNDDSSLEWSPTGIYYSYNDERARRPWTRITVRIDPGAAIWDLFVGDVMMLANIPLLSSSSSPDTPTISAAADAEVSVENTALHFQNPHFVDQNLNAIPDSFEESAGVELAFDRNSTLPAQTKSLLEAYLAAER